MERPELRQNHPLTTRERRLHDHQKKEKKPFLVWAFRGEKAGDPKTKGVFSSSGRSLGDSRRHSEKLSKEDEDTPIGKRPQGEEFS